MVNYHLYHVTIYTILGETSLASQTEEKPHCNLGFMLWVFDNIYIVGKMPTNALLHGNNTKKQEPTHIRHAILCNQPSDTVQSRL